MFFSLKRQWPFSDIGTFYEQEYLIKEFSFFIFCINELIIWLTCNPFFWSWSSIGVSILVFQYNLDWCHQIDSAYPPRHNVMNSQQFIFSLLLLYSRVSSEQCCRYTTVSAAPAILEVNLWIPSMYIGIVMESYRNTWILIFLSVFPSTKWEWMKKCKLLTDIFL